MFFLPRVPQRALRADQSAMGSDCGVTGRKGRLMYAGAVRCDRYRSKDTRLLRMLDRPRKHVRANAKALGHGDVWFSPGPTATDPQPARVLHAQKCVQGEWLSVSFNILVLSLAVSS